MPFSPFFSFPLLTLSRPQLSSPFTRQQSSKVIMEASRAIDFVGPLMLGVLGWEMAVVDILPALYHIYLSLRLTNHLSNKRKEHTPKQSTKLTFALILVSRWFAMSSIIVYLYYTRGHLEASQCRSMPFLMEAFGALVRIGNQCSN